MATDLYDVAELVHKWAGADWLADMLGHARENEAARATSKRKRTSRVAERVSPFGALVADILGLAWRGLYHLPWEGLKHASWASDRFVEVRVNGELATWDHNSLTLLVVVCHDACVRLSVSSVRGGWLSLQFSRRKRAGSMAERHPALGDHAAAIRSYFEVRSGLKLEPIDTSSKAAALGKKMVANARMLDRSHGK